MLAWTLIAVAAAETAGTLPAGAQVFYGGLGGSTYASVNYNQGAAASDGERDRGGQLRLDTYYARGLSDRLQLSAWLAPVAAGWVSDTAGLPCPGLGDTTDPAFSTYCDPVVSAGQAGLQARLRLADGPLKASAGLAAAGDPWNAARRGDYTAVGAGTLGLAPALYLGWDFSLGGRPAGALAWAAYSWRVYPALGEGSLAGSSPTDSALGGLELRVGTGAWTWQLGAQGAAGVSGVLWDERFMSEYWPTTDRWLAIRESALRLEAKASLALSETSGLHLSVGRIAAAINTADALTDIAIGVHVYVP